MDLKKYFDCKNIKGKYQQAIAKETAKALQAFCEQEPEFLQAIEQSKKIYQQCLDDIVKDIGHSCSDLEVYSRAVKFYFSTATVNFNMIIDLSGDNGYKAPPITVSHAEPEQKQDKLSLSLDSLLDF